MTAISLDQWRAFSRDERLKIACAYIYHFKRGDVREALLNNQYQAPALDRIEAVLMPLARGDVPPGSWTLAQCEAARDTPMVNFVNNPDGIKVGMYWHVLTAERKAIVKARVIRALTELGCSVDFPAMMRG
jgi:hypothetical protein